MALEHVKPGRLWAVAVALVIGFVVLAGRLFHVQVLQHEKFHRMASRQQLTQVAIPASRGSIFSSDGVELALSVPLKSICLDPELIEEPEAAAAKLSGVTGIPENQLLAQMNRKASFVWIKRGVSLDVYRRTRSLNLSGVTCCLEVIGDEQPDPATAKKSIYADPSKIEDAPAAAQALSRLLNEPVDDLLAMLTRKSRFAWVQRRVPDDQADAVLALDIAGVDARLEYERFYPCKELLGQGLGYVNADHKGMAGIEQVLDEELCGQPGERAMARASRGRLICLPGLPATPPVPGKDVVLTINSVVQHIAEQELAAAVEKWNPDRAVAVVIDPASGYVLALANWPAFDPNRYSEYSDDERKLRERNSAALDLYEPGSVFKPFVASVALELGLANENTPFNCEHGAASINGRPLRDTHPYGVIPLTAVLSKSSNIGAAKIALLLGPERLHNGLVSFGFGSRLDLPFPGLSPGLLRPVRQWSSYSISSIAIGQEVSTTAVQLCSGFAAIANDGLRMRPQVVRQIFDPQTGTVSEFEPQAIRQVISPQTAQRIRRILTAVVEEGTGRNAQLDAYQVAGKTGTAQISLPGMRGYAPGYYNGTFVGMAPADHPRACVVVTLQHPRKAHYGGTVSAPAVARILDRTLAYLGVPARSRNAGHTAQLGLAEGAD